uniref:Uncharacterized protein n=1 Tax=Lepeophtheirus salmonis TaxID=72036 RepID=A0A0K2UET3_LEPSM
MLLQHTAYTFQQDSSIVHTAKRRLTLPQPSVLHFWVPQEWPLTTSCSNPHKNVETLMGNIKKVTTNLDGDFGTKRGSGT